MIWCFSPNDFDNTRREIVLVWFVIWNWIKCSYLPKMDFPLVKLVYLAARQASGPISAFIKNRAKDNEFFRNKICIAPAQCRLRLFPIAFYQFVNSKWVVFEIHAFIVFYKFELKIHMMSKNLGRPANTPKLSEQVAIDLGANLLGEVTLFTLGSLVMIAEYCRYYLYREVNTQLGCTKCALLGQSYIYMFGDILCN